MRTARAVSSTPVLLGALLLVGAATALILLHEPRIAGGVVLLAGAAIVWGWFLAQSEGDGRSRFVSMLVDPVHDAAILAAVAWEARGTDPTVSALALVALGLSYLASYERARADALDFRTFESVGYRAVRSALIGITAWMSVALWLLIVVAAAAVVARATNVAVQHRRTRVRGGVP